MKKITELHFYSSDKQCISKFMYHARFRELDELFPDSPTMVICDAPTEYSWRTQYAKQSIAFCYACGNFFVTERELLSCRKMTKIYCPNCGREHPIRNIRKVHNQSSAIPTYIVATIIEKPDVVELNLKYEAQILNANPVHQRDFKEDTTESFLFYLNERRAVWVNDKGVSYEIGYADDCEFFVEKSALNFLNWSTKSQEGSTFSALAKTLRDLINKKMKSYGLQPCKMSIRGSHNTLVIDSICVMAHQVRFWNAPMISYYGQRISYISSFDNKPRREGFNSWCKQNHINNPKTFEQEIDKLCKEKRISYAKAFCQYFQLNVPPFAYKYITYQNIDFIKHFYSLYGVNVGNAYLPLVYQKSACQLNDFLYFYRMFKKFYPNVSASNFANYGCSKEASDILYCFKMLTEENKRKLLTNMPKFKELHDVISLILNNQRNPLITFNFVEGSLERFTRTIQNYKFDVLKDSYSCQDVGKALANCASGYGRRPNMGSTLFLVSVKRNEKLIALLEISEGSLVQAKLYANQVASVDIEANNTILYYAHLCKLNIATRDVKSELDRTQVATA